MLVGAQWRYCFFPFDKNKIKTALRGRLESAQR